MNKTFRTVWNEALGAWVAASEISKSRGKSSKSAVVAAALVSILMGGFATGANAQALGTGSVPLGSAATAISGPCNGNNATATVDSSFGVAVGCGALSGNGRSPAQDANGAARPEVPYSNIAIGANAKAPTTIGSSGAAIRGSNIAIGGGAQATGDGANGGDQIALGNEAVAFGADSISIGGQTAARGLQSIMIGGNYSEVDAASGNSMVIGIAGKALNAPNSIVLGNNSQATAANATLIGVASGVSAANGTALGFGTTVSNPNSVAIGQGTQATTAQTNVAGATINGTAYTYAGTTPSGTVSFGNSSTERQLTNVAAGRVTAQSTDGVNGSQLFAAQQAIEGVADNAVQYDNSTKTSVTLNPGGNATTVTNVADGNIAPGSTDAVNGSQLNTTNTNVTNLGTTVTNLDGRVTNIYDTGTKYFHARSTADDAVAGGAESTAMGPTATANGDSAVAAGDRSDASGAGSVAVGQQSKASSTSSIAVGQNSEATQLGSIAIGQGAISRHAGSVALGLNSVADGTTLGTAAYTPLAGAPIAGVTPVGEVSVGSDGSERRITHVAAGATDTDAVNVSQLRAVTAAATADAVLYDNSTHTSITLGGEGGTIIHNVAPGVAGTDAVNLNQLNSVVNNSTNKWVTGNPTTYAAPTATGTNSTAVGSGATSSGSNSVALGNNSNDGGRANVVSVGATGAERQVTNVAAGTQTTDAVNLGQLRPFADALGGGTKVNTDGSITGPTYNITNVDGSGGTTTTTYNNVGDALGGLSNSVVNLNDAVNNITTGAGIKYFHANSSAADSVASGAESTAMGPAASATGESAVAAGDRSTASGAGSVAVGQQSVASGASSVAVGQGSQATNTGSIAIGLNSQSSGVNTVAIGTGSVATNSVAVGAGAQAGGGSAAFGDDAIAINAIKGTALGNGANVTSTGGVALGAGAVAERAGLGGQREAVSGVAVSSAQGAVSVGSAGNERQITNVAGGTQATDAVNLRQLQAAQAGNVRYETNADGTTNFNNVTLGNGEAPNGTTVSNVAPGVAGTDAVNVNQLNQGLAGANQYTDSKVGELRGDIANVGKDASAGAAGAMALSTLPQSTIPGKGMLSAGVAAYDGQAAIAIGVSKLSDNGRWVVKFGGTANSRGKVGVAGGVGFHW